MRYSALKGIPPSGDIVGPFELLRNIQTIPIIIAKAFIPLKLFVLGSYDWGMTGLGLGIIGIIAGILMNRKVEGSTILFWILWFYSYYCQQWLQVEKMVIFILHMPNIDLSYLLSQY